MVGALQTLDSALAGVDYDVQGVKDYWSGQKSCESAALYDAAIERLKCQEEALGYGLEFIHCNQSFTLDVQDKTQLYCKI